MSAQLIAQVHDTGPGYVVLASPSPELDAANRALANYLGSDLLTPATLLDIVSAGVRALGREASTAAAIHLDSARESLEVSTQRVVDTFRAASEETARRVTEETAARVQDAVLRATTGLPAAITEATAASLDPTRPGSPAAVLAAITSQELGKVSGDMRDLRDSVVARVADDSARAEEREKSSAKGMDFETAVNELLSAVTEAEGVEFQDTSTETGALARSKKGDFVVLDAGRPLVVIEAKNSTTFVGPAQIHSYLDEAMRNRNVNAAVWVVNGVAQNRGELVRFLTPTRISVAVTGEPGDVHVLRAVLRCALAVARKDTTTSTVTGIRDKLTALSSLDAGLRRMVTEADSLLTSARTLKTSASDIRLALSDGVSELIKILDAADAADDTSPAGQVPVLSDQGPFASATPARVTGFPGT